MLCITKSEWSRKIFYILLTVLLSARTQIIASDKEWITNGPIGGHIYTIVSSKTNSSIVWCGTKNSGIFKSSDGGGTWSSANDGITIPTSITALSINQTNENILYAGSSIGRIYKSTDGGKTWTLTNADSTGFQVYSLATAPTNSDVVYAARRGKNNIGGLFKSTDGGTTWVVLSNGLPPMTPDVRVIKVHPDSSNVVYIGVYGFSPFIQGGIYKSTNSGENWIAMNTGLSNISLISLAIDPTNGKTLYAGTDRGGIYRTTNAGNIWTAVNNGIGNKIIEVVSVDITGKVFCGSDGGGIYKSTNRGETWIEINTGLLNLSVWSLASSITDANIVYAGTKGGGVYKTNNAGSSWSGNNIGLTAAIINDLKVNQSNYSDIIYAATDGNGIFKSTNDGLNWISVSNELPNLFIQSLAVDPSNDAIVYCGTSDGKILKTVDGGVNWLKISADSAGLPVYSIAINPSNSSIVYIARQKSMSPSILKTTDAGASWIELNTGLPSSPNVRALVINSMNTDIVYAGIWGLAPFVPGGIYKSTNGGSTWTEMNNGLTNVSITSLAINKTDVNILYTGTASGGGIFKTTDAGQKWVPQGPLLAFTEVVNAISINPLNENIIFAGTSNNLYESINGGSNWQQINDVFHNLQVKTLSISKSRIYTGTDGNGVYSSLNNITSVKELVHNIPEEFILSQNYPNPFNPETNINYSVSTSLFISLKIYNTLGQEIRTLINENQRAGEHTIRWDGKDNFGRSVSSGIYLYRIEAGSVAFIKKMILLK